MKSTDPFNFDEAAVSQMENIRRIGLRRLRNRGEIDDFVQETLTRAYAKRDQLRDEAKFDRWIAVIARNLAAEWNRSAFYRNEREDAADEIPEPPDFRTPHDILEEKEEREQLHRAMGRLNDDDREMLRDRYFDEASYQELQEKYGLSYSAVGFRLHRAKARLRKLLTSTAAAFIAAFAGFKRAAFAIGGIVIMTKSTKIVLGVTAALIAALLGGYLWLEHSQPSDDSQSALTPEEQSPRISQPALSQTERSGASSSKSDSNAEPLQTSEAAQNGAENGAAEEPSAETAAPTSAPLPPDAFTAEFQKAVEAIPAFADKFQAQFPEVSIDFPKAAKEMADSLLKHEADLRQQGMDVNERKKQLKTKYLELRDSFSVSGRTEVVTSKTFEFAPGKEPSEVDILQLQVEVQAEAARRGNDITQFMMENFPTQLEEMLGVTDGFSGAR